MNLIEDADWFNKMLICWQEIVYDVNVFRNNISPRKVLNEKCIWKITMEKWEDDKCHKKYIPFYDIDFSQFCRVFGYMLKIIIGESNTRLKNLITRQLLLVSRIKNFRSCQLKFTQTNNTLVYIIVQHHIVL